MWLVFQSLSLLGLMILWHGATFLGFGYFLLFPTAKKLGGSKSLLFLFSSFWLGLFAVISLLQVAHLFVKIDWKVNLLFSVVGLYGFTLFLRDRIIPWKTLFLGVLFSSPLFLYVALSALQVPINFDSGLYHFNSVRWINEYAVVPGLVNVYINLAFNQSYFLYVAFLNVSPWGGLGHHVANSLLYLVVCGQMVCLFIESVKSPNIKISRSVFSLGVIAVLLFILIDPGISSPSPDLPIFVLGIVIAWGLFELFFWKTDRIEERFLIQVLLLALSVLGITFKLSFIGFGGTVILLIILRLLVTSGWRSFFTDSRYPAFLCVILVSSWMLHGVALSGYPLFPSTIAAAPVEWKLDEKNVEKQADVIKGWARKPHAPREEVIDTWQWLPEWWERLIRYKQNRMPLYFSSLGFLGLLSLFVSKKHVVAKVSVLLPFLGSLLFWFFTAPDPRFLGSALWCFCLWGGVVIFDDLHKCVPFISLPFMGVAILCFLLWSGMKSKNMYQRVVSSDFGEIPMVSLKEYVNPFGITFLIPEKGVQVWDSPLPGAPVAPRAVRLRGESLSSGFIGEAR